MSRLIPIIALAFAIALFFLYIKPTYSGPINERRQQIASYNDALDAADRFQQKEVQLTQARAQIPAESLSRLNAFLPDGVDNVQLILDMDALAARSGVTLSDFDIKGSETDSSSPTSAASTPATANTTASAPQALSPQTGLGLTSSSPIDSINLTFKATGTYAAFRSFLGGMENSLRPLDITDLDISESATGVYSYGVTVRIYWLR